MMIGSMKVLWLLLSQLKYIKFDKIKLIDCFHSTKDQLKIKKFQFKV